MLYGYAQSLPNYKDSREIDLIILRIKSDLNSLVRVKIVWLVTNGLKLKALLILIESMEKDSMNTIDIRAIKEDLR